MCTMTSKPFRPEYPCLAVRKEEIEVFEAYDGPLTEFYKIYVDDILGAASMSRENLDRFIKFCQQFISTHSFNTSVPSQFLR